MVCIFTVLSVDSVRPKLLVVLHFQYNKANFGQLSALEPIAETPLKEHALTLRFEAPVLVRH